jgi:hypothetical protein
MKKDALRRHYHYLWTGEAVAAMLFVGLLLWFADGRWQQWIARTYSLSIVILILIQGIVWWRLKLRLLRGNQHRMRLRIRASFRFWRRVNWWLIGGFPLVVLITTRLTNQPIISVDTLIGLLFLGGAMLEQINYYYYQLMYDSAEDWKYLRKYRRLRRGNIAKALDADLT